MDSANQTGSRFLVVSSDDVPQIEALSRLFPRLTSMIRNNKDKNLVLNFKDDRQRSLIVMIVANASVGRHPVAMAS